MTKSKTFTSGELQAKGFVAVGDEPHFQVPMGVTAADFERLPKGIQDLYGPPESDGVHRAKWLTPAS